MPMDNIRTRINTQCDIKFSEAKPNPLEAKTNNLMKRLARGASNDLICECVKERGCIKYGGVVETFKLILQTEGVRGFYKGFMPRAATQSMSTAVAWSTYEMMKKFIIGDGHKK
jgi:hypothetical protein